MRHALISDSYKPDQIYLFEFDKRNLADVKSAVTAKPEFYVRQVYEDVPFKHFLRIITYYDSCGIEEMV